MMASLGQKPLVSIGFTVFNGASRMRPALDSLLAQTHRNLEIIISDNASTDDTEKVCREYAARDSRIRYVRQSKNIGQVPNFVFVLKLARGEYFMWAADDDTRAPQCVEKLVEALETHPEHGAAICSYHNVYGNGALRDAVMFDGAEQINGDNYYVLYKKMILNKPIHHVLHGLHRREHLIKFFARKTPQCIRWDRVFMAEYALGTQFASVPETLFFKHVARESAVERYPNDMVGNSYQDPFAYTRYAGLLLWRPLTSRHIPWHRKPRAAMIWIQALWQYKRKIAKEYMDAFAS